jgi:hypothetical protein
MQNRHQKPIHRVDVRELEKMALLDSKQVARKPTAAGKKGAPHRIVRPARWM